MSNLRTDAGMETNGFSLRFGLCLAVALWLASAAAEEPPVPAHAPERSASVAVRSTLRSELETPAPAGVSRLTTSYGSGTIVGRCRGRYAVLTCRHVLLNNGRHTVEVAGQRYAAEVLAVAAGPDLALLGFSGPDALPWVPLAPRSPNAAAIAHTGGYPRGEPFTARQATVREFRPGQGIVLGTYNREGESGGGVFEGGRLFAVMWGHDPQTQTTLAVPVERIHAFLRNHRIQLEDAAPAPLPFYQRVAPPPAPGPLAAGG